MTAPAYSGLAIRSVLARLMVGQHLENAANDTPYGRSVQLHFTLHIPHPHIVVKLS